MLCFCFLQNWVVQWLSLFVCIPISKSRFEKHGLWFWGNIWKFGNLVPSLVFEHFFFYLVLEIKPAHRYSPKLHWPWTCVQECTRGGPGVWRTWWCNHPAFHSSWITVHTSLSHSSWSATVTATKCVGTLGCLQHVEFMWSRWSNRLVGRIIWSALPCSCCSVWQALGVDETA
jgi:hypothetical protein